MVLSIDGCKNRFYAQTLAAMAETLNDTRKYFTICDIQGKLVSFAIFVVTFVDIALFQYSVIQSCFLTLSGNFPQMPFKYR